MGEKQTDHRIHDSDIEPTATSDHNHDDELRNVDEPTHPDTVGGLLGRGVLGTPERKLAKAASGDHPVDQKHINAMLAKHLVSADEQVGDLAKHISEMTEFFFHPERGDNVNADELLKLIERLTRLYGMHMNELRKTSDLLARLARPDRPQLQVLAVGSGQVNVGGQVAAAVDLGEGRRR